MDETADRGKCPTFNGSSCDRTVFENIGEEKFEESKHTVCDNRGTLDCSQQTLSEDLEADFLCSCCYELLVEPTTLVCGHNFCRSCLAAWALTSLKKECPTCRQVWQGHPQVNITLRKMMHRLLGKKILAREEDVLKEANYQQRIHDFDLQMSATPTQQTADIGAFCTGICITLLVILTAYLVLFWGRSDEDLLIHKPVLRWKTDDVVHWLMESDWAHSYVSLVQQHNIDGPLLLSLDENGMEALLNISDALHRHALSLAIHHLRQTGVKIPGNLWEFKTLYPGLCLFLVYGLRDSPRATILYLYFLYYDDIFVPCLHFTTGEDTTFTWSQMQNPTYKQWVLFLTNAALLPYWLIARFTWTVFSRQSWTSSIILLNCVLLTWLEISAFKRFIRQCCLRSMWMDIKNYFKLVLTAFMTSLVWPLIPGLLGDVLFYANLYWSPLQQAQSLYQYWLTNRH